MRSAAQVCRSCLLVFVLAAGLRVGWVLARFGPEGRAEHLDYPDEEAYVMSARSLAAGSGLMDEFGYRATYMPAYPAFLAVFQPLQRPLLWSRLVQALLAAWAAPATLLLTRQFLGLRAAARPPPSPTAPILAGIAVAVDPFLLFFSGLLLTEALYAAALVSAWLFVLPMARRDGLAIRRAALWGFGAGGLSLVGLLLRPAAAAVVIAVPAAVLLIGRCRSSAWVYVAAMLAFVVVGLCPWAARNQRVVGEWRWLSTRGGVSLYDGVQPGASGGSDLGHTKRDPRARGLSETQWDRYFQDAAIHEIRRDPARILRLAGRKLLRTWSLTPNEAHYRAGPIAIISAAWMVVLLIGAAAGWWRWRHEAGLWMLLLLPVAAFTGLHMVYVGSVRYRVPVMPFVMVLSAVGMEAILRRLWVRMVPR